MRAFLSPLSDGLALLLPRDCPVCRGDLPWNAPAGICLSCWSDIRPIPPPFCRRCGLPYDSFIPPETAHLCSACHRKPPPFETARSLALYDGTIREVLHLFKYDRRPEIGAILGKLMAIYFETVRGPARPDAIVAVPLHRARKRKRGYNQAEILARAVGKSLRIPRIRGCLARSRAVPPQTGLSRFERRKNVRNSFRVRRPGRLQGKSILLVDDILTTGATITECASTLHRAGTSRVLILTAARTVNR